MHRPHPEAALALAVLGISIAAPLVRLSDAHPIAIAFWRLAFSLGFVLVALLATGTWRELRTLTRTELAIGVAAGVMLAVHFWSWNASVDLTTIAASTTLVSLQPAIVAVLSAILLRERPRAVQVAGILIALAGAFVISTPALFSAAAAVSPNAPLGNTLALLGAVTASIYYLSGRRLRTGLGLWPYVAVVYGACFASLAAMAVASGVDLAPQPPREIWIFLGLAIGPMLLGHTAMNYALRYRPAYVVNLTVLAEPVGATLIAAALPGIREIPPLSTVAGGAVILAGVVLTVLGERPSRRSEAAVYTTEAAG
ncbi:MAG: DMT family transporter [Gemmatimonadaceae bacterium]|nr:DMT family transporter [Gemmatimonadaceae bacterium]